MFEVLYKMMLIIYEENVLYFIVIEKYFLCVILEKLDKSFGYNRKVLVIEGFIVLVI